MGSFVFKWTQPAHEVYVTGTFDNWSKSEKLERIGNVFEKKVSLPDTSKKIYYKFVVDGTWTTDHQQPQENDDSGIVNNFLLPEHITKDPVPATAAIMSGVTPQSTTAELAKSVPLENGGSADLPGSFPETPGLETPGLQTGNSNKFSVNPIPASEGAGNPIKLAAGEKVPEPSTINSNTINSSVKLDKESYENGEGEPSNFSVNPIPASEGVGNPVKLNAGEKVPEPSTINSNTINTNVTLDKESYENGENAPVLPPVVTPQNERDANGTGVFNLPPITSNLIPESSLPIGTDGVGTYDANPTIQSAAPLSSTAQLAAAVPLESSKVPETVVESQKEAGVDPEASAVPEEVQEKKDVEKELLKEIPEAPATSEGTAGKGTDKSEKTVTAGEAAAAVGGAAVAAGGAAAAAAYAAKDKVVEATNGKPTTSPSTVPAESTPEVVKESIAESGQSAEAAAYKEPIAEKSAVEKELLSEIKPENSTGEPAPKIIETPAPTETSIPALTTTTPSGLNADASSAVAGKPTISPDSRDISPSTVPGTHTQTQPQVTTGVGASTVAPVTPAKDIGSSSGKSTASKDNAASVSAASDKKKKRRSIFGQIKDKFSGHKKEKAAEAN